MKNFPRKIIFALQKNKNVKYLKSNGWDYPFRGDIQSLEKGMNQNNECKIVDNLLK